MPQASLSFEGLIAKAMRIGVDEIAFPIDVFSTATEIAEHQETDEKLDRLLALVEDQENYFTRWTAIRAIRQMGQSTILRAQEVLMRQASAEDYELAAKEIDDALSMLQGPTST